MLPDTCHSSLGDSERMRLILVILVSISTVTSLKMAPPPGLKPAKERFATTISSTTTSTTSSLNDEGDSPNSPTAFTILKRPKGLLRSRESSSASREIGEMGRSAATTTPYTVAVTHGSVSTRKNWRNGLGVHTQVVTTLVDQNGQYSRPTHIAIPAYRVKYAPKSSVSEIQLSESDWATLRYGTRKSDDNILN